MKIVVVIPTYNEKENIKVLAPILDEVFKKSDYDFHVLIVDGNSPDGTGELVTELSKKYKFLHLLLEKKKAGIGAAYFYGFKYAMDEMGADILVEMDADLQHDPKVLPDIVKPIIDNKADHVIGSRFVKGGSIPREWAIHRKFFSIGGSLFSKIVLGIYNVNDFTTGYKATRVKGFADKLNFDNVSSASFAYKVDLLFKLHRLGARIKEVPITFGLRDRGESKIESNTFFDTLKVVVMLRANEHKSFVKFIMVGFTGLFVDAGLFNIFRLLPFLTSSLGAFFSGSVAMLTTFLLNNYWSFGERKLKDTKDKAKGVIIYFVFSYVPILVRSKLVHLFALWFGDNFISNNVAFFIGIFFGLIWNYTVYSKIIWKKEK